MSVQHSAHKCCNAQKYTSPAPPGVVQACGLDTPRCSLDYTVLTQWFWFGLSFSLSLYIYMHIYIYIYGLKAMAWNLVINGPRALVSSSIMHFPKQWLRKAIVSNPSEWVLKAVVPCQPIYTDRFKVLASSILYVVKKHGFEHVFMRPQSMVSSSWVSRLKGCSRLEAIPAKG